HIVFLVLAATDFRKDKPAATTANIPSSTPRNNNQFGPTWSFPIMNGCKLPQGTEQRKRNMPGLLAIKVPVAS
ncbi:MAG: hypothetical protein ACYDH1_18925, partial [Anaerolineaceae bacterium]